MIAVSICDSEYSKKYRFNYLKTGQRKINEFPVLRTILENFKNFDSERYDNNIFLNWAKRACMEKKEEIVLENINSSILKKGLEYLRNVDEIRAQKILEDLESLFNNSLILDDLKREKRESIKTKVKSFDNQQSQGIFQELYLFIELLRNPKVSDTKYENFEDGNHDFRILIDNEEFNLEITGLRENEVDQIVRKAFKKAGTDLIKEVPMNILLFIYINLKLLKNMYDRFDETYIIDLLKKSFKAVKPILLTSESHVLFDKDLLLQTSWTLHQFYEFYRREEFGISQYDIIELLNKMSKDDKNISYLRKTKTDLFSNFPIEAFSNSKCIGKKCVQLTQWTIFPSESEEERIEAKLNQFTRRLKCKLEENQLQGQKNSILVIQFTDFYFNRYSKRDLTREEFVKRISPIVKQCFRQSIQKNPLEIIGLIVYEDSLKEGIFFINPMINVDETTKKKINLVCGLNK